MSSERDAAFANITAVQTGLAHTGDVPEMYKEWHKQYDKDLNAVGYGAPELTARYLHKHLTALGGGADSDILDIGAGTGIVMKYLAELGYSHVDAMDGSQDMLDHARKLNLYRDIFCCLIGDGNKLPMADNSYDAATMCGCFAGGHLKCDSLLEVMRVVKPGGVIVQVMREENTRKVAEYTKLLPLCQKWVEEGRWRRLEETIPPPDINLKFYMDLDALVQVYQVL